MKKLIVCGDSYMSPDVKYPGTHFSEIIAKDLGYDLVAYSRGGMSNGGICIQIQTAINQNSKPDLILVGSTWFTRLEWAINNIRSINKFTVTDMIYDLPNLPSLSCTYKWLNKDPQLVSMSDYINIDEKYDKYSAERKNALELYQKYLLHPDWKREVDIMCLYATYHQLHMSKIPYIICKEQSRLVVEKCEWLDYGIDNMNYAAKDVGQTLYNTHIPGTPDYDMGYHTSVETQWHIAKMLLKDYIPKILK